MKKKNSFKCLVHRYFFSLMGLVLLSLNFGRAQESTGNEATMTPTNPSSSTVEGSKSDSKQSENQNNSNTTQGSSSNINFETAPDYRYEPVGKRDPFRPFRDSKVGVGLIRTPSRSLDPLEKFDVKSLEVVAIVWSNEKPKALIQDPEKGLHSVYVGQRIGKNEGYVAEIREGEVVLFELYDLNGKIIKEPYILCIDKTKGCGS